MRSLLSATCCAFCQVIFCWTLMLLSLCVPQFLVVSVLPTQLIKLICFRLLPQPLGKKKQEAAMLAAPLPRMTEDAAVAKPTSAAEKLELDKWIQERKASYPSTAALAAKQADADRSVQRKPCKMQHSASHRPSHCQQLEQQSSKATFCKSRGNIRHICAPQACSHRGAGC